MKSQKRLEGVAKIRNVGLTGKIKEYNGSFTAIDQRKKNDYSFLKAQLHCMKK